MQKNYLPYMGLLKRLIKILISYYLICGKIREGSVLTIFTFIPQFETMQDSPDATVISTKKIDITLEMLDTHYFDRIRCIIALYERIETDYNQDLIDLGIKTEVEDWKDLVICSLQNKNIFHGMFRVLAIKSQRHKISFYIHISILCNRIFKYEFKNKTPNNNFIASSLGHELFITRFFSKFLHRMCLISSRIVPVDSIFFLFRIYMHNILDIFFPTLAMIKDYNLDYFYDKVLVLVNLKPSSIQYMLCHINFDGTHMHLLSIILTLIYYPNIDVLCMMDCETDLKRAVIDICYIIDGIYAKLQYGIEEYYFMRCTCLSDYVIYDLGSNFDDNMFLKDACIEKLLHNFSTFIDNCSSLPNDSYEWAYTDFIDYVLYAFTCRAIGSYIMDNILKTPEYKIVIYAVWNHGMFAKDNLELRINQLLFVYHKCCITQNLSHVLHSKYKFYSFILYVFGDYSSLSIIQSNKFVEWAC